MDSSEILEGLNNTNTAIAKTKRYIYELESKVLEKDTTIDNLKIQLKTTKNLNTAIVVFSIFIITLITLLGL